MLQSRKITGEFVAVFVIGTLVGAMAMWDWAAKVENKYIGFENTWEPTDVGAADLSARQVESPEKKLSDFMAHTNDSDKLVDRITQKYVNEYHFSPEEMSRIQPMITEMAQHVSQVRRAFGGDILDTLDAYHEKISQLLTPEHRAVYDKANAERKTQLRKMLLLDPSPSSPAAK